MTLSFFAAWFVMMFPLVFSPGPANVTFAATGAKFGVKRSLPLMAGIDLVSLLYSIVIGFGAGVVFQRYPSVLMGMQYFAAAYLSYLAYKFYQASTVAAIDDDCAAPSFWDGVVLQLFNVKGVSMVVVMFSAFSHEQSVGRIVWLIVLLCLMNIITHLFWISASSWLASRFQSERFIKIQNQVFASMLLGVAVWLVV